MLPCWSSHCLWLVEVWSRYGSVSRGCSKENHGSRYTTNQSYDAVRRFSNTVSTSKLKKGKAFLCISLVEIWIWLVELRLESSKMNHESTYAHARKGNISRCGSRNHWSNYGSSHKLVSTLTTSSDVWCEKSSSAYRFSVSRRQVSRLCRTSLKAYSTWKNIHLLRFVNWIHQLWSLSWIEINLD